MTGEQSRLSKVGDRVCWAQDPNDKGTVAANDWSAVKIKWDTGFTTEILHNDMAKVQIVK